MAAISNRVQAAYSADKCSDTADETVRLLHLQDWSDLEWLAEESLQRKNVATTGRWRVLLWLLSLFSAYVSHGGWRSVAFVPRCEIHHSFPEPPGFRECQRAKLCRRTMGPPFWMWHIPVGAVFKHPLILCLWVGLVGATLTTQPTPPWPRATAAAGSLHFHRSHLHRRPELHCQTGEPFFSTGLESVDPWAQFVAYILAHMMSSLSRWAEVMEQANSNRFKRFLSSLSLQFVDFFFTPYSDWLRFLISLFDAMQKLCWNLTAELSLLLHWSDWNLIQQFNFQVITVEKWHHQCLHPGVRWLHLVTIPWTCEPSICVCQWSKYGHSPLLVICV